MCLFKCLNFCSIEKKNVQCSRILSRSQWKLPKKMYDRFPMIINCWHCIRISISISVRCSRATIVYISTHDNFFVHFPSGGGIKIHVIKPILTNQITYDYFFFFSLRLLLCFLFWIEYKMRKFANCSTLRTTC